MIARAVTRGGLGGLTKNSVLYHVLAGAADEDAEQYLQMARLRKIFDLANATGSDLDERAKEIKPSLLTRRQPTLATGAVVFARQGTTGVVAIPTGTVVQAADEKGAIKFRTTSAGSIPDAAGVSGAIPIVALTKGTRANVSAGAINKIATRVPGVATVTNDIALTNGQDTESDDRFRDRLYRHVQSLSRGTPVALASAATSTQLDDGRRVLYAKVDEPVVPNGWVTVYIDDGTGQINEFSEDFLGAPDELVASASGGEEVLHTSERPIRDDGSFVLRINSVVQTRGVDYEINDATGAVELVTPLVTADQVEADYRYDTGLVQEAQRIINGDELDSAVNGYYAAGTYARVKAASLAAQTLTGKLSVLAGYDIARVVSQAVNAVTEYINTLNIGSDVIASEIIERVMSLPGVYNFRITDLTGSAGVDQTVLPYQVARIIANDVSIL